MVYGEHRPEAAVRARALARAGRRASRAAGVAADRRGGPLRDVGVVRGIAAMSGRQVVRSSRAVAKPIDEQGGDGLSVLGSAGGDRIQKIPGSEIGADFAGGYRGCEKCLKRRFESLPEVRGQGWRRPDLVWFQERPRIAAFILPGSRRARTGLPGPARRPRNRRCCAARRYALAHP